MKEKTNKIRWHNLLAWVLKELLSPLDIQVLTEVQVVSEPPRADIILLRRKDKTWTKEQWKNLADGLRDTDAKTLLIEFKYSESISDDVFEKLLVYDYLYRQSEKLQRDQLQSFLISAKTPGSDILNRYGFEATDQKGVYFSRLPLVSSIQVILLNKIADAPHNAVIKCFASRTREKEKAFKTMMHHVLRNQRSITLASVISGLKRAACAVCSILIKNK